jgi:REP-associated tyrosine transposase
MGDGVFHVTAHRIDDDPLFVVDLDRIDFLDLLASVTDRFEWLCDTYCLMGTHYHLLIKATQEMLSAGMKRLNGVYAQRFNQRHRRRGHVFESRFGAFLVTDERHLGAVREYVINNPVRAGLCEEAADWPWSSSTPVI